MILYITRKFPPSIGGIQQFNYQLSQRLKTLTDLIMIKWGGSQAALPIFYPVAFFRALWICATKNITCIYISDGLLGPLGWALKLLTRKPVIVSIHGSDICWEFPPYQWLVPRFLRRLDRVICVSQFLKEQCIKRGISEKKIFIIPNGVSVDEHANLNTSEARKAVAEQFCLLLEGKKILLSVGRLMWNKGIDPFLAHTFPKISKTCPNAVYCIVGNGPQRKDILQIIENNKLQDNVFLLGSVPINSDELRNLYAACDVCIMPNSGREGFGIVALEAAASGKPLVATRIGGITEAVKDGTSGILVDLNDYDQFAHTVIDLLNDDERCRHLGQLAQEHVRQHFDWMNIAKQYKEILVDPSMDREK